MTLDPWESYMCACIHTIRILSLFWVCHMSHHMSITLQSHVHHMPVTCPSHASHMLTAWHSVHAGAVVVTYRATVAEGSSAIADEDFFSQERTVTFANGEESKAVDIPVIDVSNMCVHACVRASVHVCACVCACACVCVCVCVYVHVR